MTPLTAALVQLLRAVAHEEELRRELDQVTPLDRRSAIICQRMQDEAADMRSRAEAAFEAALVAWLRERGLTVTEAPR